MEFLSLFGSKFTILEQRVNSTLAERLTLNRIKELTRPTDRILYIHSKGARPGCSMVYSPARCMHGVQEAKRWCLLCSKPEGSSSEMMGTACSMPSCVTLNWQHQNGLTHELCGRRTCAE